MSNRAADAPALRALLAGAIDYAGLFPPAALDLDTAIRNYARYRATPEAWMLGRFIIPAGRLRELSPYITELFAAGDPLRLSVLGRGGAEVAAFQAGLAADTAAMNEFRSAHGSRIEIGVFEVKPPVAAYDSLTAPADVATYWEFTLAGGWQAQVTALLDHVGQSGVKLRCGGLEPAAFPTSAQVAFALAEAARRTVRIKFTAGLHHPVRRFDLGVNCKMHGFLNVYAAGLMAARGVPAATLEQVLEDDDPKSFRIGDQFCYRDNCFAPDFIHESRIGLTSFGSCSFDEPRDDLRALGLL
ncbi:MAG: hypothetical protein K1X57_08275 [Gemmataceae bacterium]|nr:hypothetical protein [Gemmataceae bacterium]